MAAVAVAAVAVVGVGDVQKVRSFSAFFVLQ